ncbi:MAG: glycoside hydrolase family 31 protein [Cyclobacteriaceae bacterium]|nr:glycoside hydrolase family 31 protein [Cyclobacteriaceae bacterium]
MSHLNSTQVISPGKIQKWKKSGNGIIGHTDHAHFKIIFYGSSIARVTLTRQPNFEDFSYAVVAQPGQVELNINESGKEIIIESDALRIFVNTDSLKIKFANKNNEVLNEDDLTTLWNGEQVTSYKKLQDGERFIGLGEKTGPLNRRGHGYVNWNTDSYGYNSASDPLYCSTPFYIGIHSGLQYGIYLDNTFKTHFNFGASNNRFSSFSADAGEMNYYFIAGATVREIITHYTHLTGRMPLPPRWSIGYQQCRYSYFPDKEVLNVARTFREKDIPADAIVFDIHYMDAYKIFSWHPSHFSNPKSLIEKLKDDKFEVVVMCDPGIKVEKGYHAYDDGVRDDVFIKYPDGSYYTGQVWPGWCHFPDFTSPKARRWWANKFKDYIELGIEGFWNDMNEIATWGNQLPDNIGMSFEDQHDTIRRGRNIYGFQMARATYEGTKQLLKGKRPFNLTRSAFSGIQRYAAVWTGDNIATDEHMMLGVRLLNSMGLTGLSFCGYDAGGFVGDAHPKLFGRWISIAAFSPFFRGHSMVNSRDAEPWSFGEEVEEISRNYIKLRYRLMPYLYSAFCESSITGMPVQRSLAIDYPHEEKVYLNQYQHQYFFGDSILVAPVESHRELTKVFLPQGDWYSLFDDLQYTGGEIMVECPIEKLPVFVKGSSIIVMDGDQVNNTKSKSTVLEIHIYNGQNSCSFTLYQDDGSTFAYEQGEFSLQTITFDPDKSEIDIEPTKGDFESQYSDYRIYFHGFGSLSKVKVDQKPVSISQADYRLVQPLRSFDPVVQSNEGYKIPSLPFIELKASQETIKIQY